MKLYEFDFSKKELIVRFDLEIAMPMERQTSINEFI